MTNPDSTREVQFSYSDNFKNIFDLYINNSTTDKKLLGSKQVADSMAEFALGQCVMVQNGNWAWSQINDIAGNVVKKEDIKFMPIYTGMEEDSSQGLCIGTENFLCINSKATPEEQKRAADFLYWLYSSDTGKEFVTEKLNFITPFDTFDASERSKDPLSLQVSEWIEKKDITTIPWNFTLFPSQNFKSDFGSALLQYAQGNMTWEQVKETILDDSNKYEDVKDAIRDKQMFKGSKVSKVIDNITNGALTKANQAMGKNNDASLLETARNFTYWLLQKGDDIFVKANFKSRCIL